MVLLSAFAIRSTERAGQWLQDNLCETQSQQHCKSRRDGKFTEPEWEGYAVSRHRDWAGNPELEAPTWDHTFPDSSEGWQHCQKLQAAVRLVSALCKALLSDRFTQVPFVLLQPLCCWILHLTCVLIVVLIAEPFRCNPCYKALSVIHLKGTPDSRCPFCCIY